MSGQRILIVDDEASIRDMLGFFFHKRGFEVLTASNFTEGQASALRSTPDLILSDIKMPDGNGLDLLRRVKAESPKTPVIMITAHTSTPDAIEAMKAGAVDYIAKPFNIEELGLIVDRALGEKQLRDENIYLKQELAAKYTFANIIGKGSRMQEIFRTIERIAKVSSTVLLTGESGTGKELIARAIHYTSIRKDRKFVSINCGALPEPLLESELFGHERGAFTGAIKDKRGLFTEADNGTLFLDEISETTVTMQVKLLRAIQEKSIRAVGANTETNVDVRILSATHKDLSRLVAEGRFRQDLYYRINVIELRVPPLRERLDDLAGLSAKILARLADAQGRAVPSLADDAVQALRDDPFPGNVRELENILERALALADDDILAAADLRLPQSAAPATPAGEHPAAAAPAAGVDPRTLDPRDTATSALPSYIEEIERAAIQHALQENRYNKTRTAAALGITFRALRYKLKKFGID
jgi:two-component system response regulator PilR (NtrC family)